MEVIFYTKEKCLLCDEAYSLLEMMQGTYDFDIEVRDIYTNDEWLEEYQIIIPVIQIKDTILTGDDINIERLVEIFEKLQKKN